MLDSHWSTGVSGRQNSDPKDSYLASSQERTGVSAAAEVQISLVAVATAALTTVPTSRGQLMRVFEPQIS